MSSPLGPRVDPGVVAALRASLDQGRAALEEDDQSDESPEASGYDDESLIEHNEVDPTSMPTILGAASARRGDQRILRTAATGRPYSAPGGVPRVERMTALMDDVLGKLVEAARKALNGQVGDVALVALGGYGRHELGLRSDVDLLFLVSGQTPEASAKFSEVVLYALWDLGVEVGHAVRTPEATLSWAESDQSILSSLLDARLISAGVGPNDSHQLAFNTVERGINAMVARPDIGQALIQAKLDEAQRRYTRYGETIYLLEPNVKESAGGLRDLHAAQWIARVRYKTHGIHQLLKLGVLSPEEHRALLRAYDFLLRVRFELHRITMRRQDNLRFEQQEKIARILGYQDVGATELERNKLGVERFMRAYYFHARQLRVHSGAIVDRATHVPPKKGHRPRAAPRGFRLWGGKLTVRSADQFTTDPSAMVRIFDVAQEEGVEIHPYAKHLLFENRMRLDRVWRRDRRIVDPFLSVLENPQHDATWVEQMHDVGLLKSIIPEMARVTGRWQHSLYHVYTVDIHSLKVLGWAKRLRRGDYREEMPALTRMIEELARPCVLYLACLLHDIGKGWRREDHSVRGAKVARIVGDRLGGAESSGWTEEETVDLVWLVKDHLLMSDIAQRRDVSDPKLVQQFAETVGSEERLEMLYLLTVVDMMGTSPRVWNSWKASLLRELYVNSRAALRSHDGEGARRYISARRRRAQKALVAEFGGGKTAEEQAHAFFSVVPDRYLLSVSRHRMARHVRMWSDVRQHGGLATHVSHIRRDGISTFTVVCRDRPGMLAAVAGVLAANELSILSASVFSVPDGLDVPEATLLSSGNDGDFDHVRSATSGGSIALDVMHVTDVRGGVCDDRERWARVRSELESVLLSRDDSHQQVLRRVWKRRGISYHRPAVKTEVNVVVDQGEEVVIDVFCEDHLGVLWLISETLAEEGLAVTLARVSTQGHRVADGFYIRDAQTGDKVTEERVRSAASALRDALQELPDPD
ncbi:MAG: [protein-PII] uridylyltransferase [Myxococcales bacterium]|nr:[protein-PII] uridylyltransferase [Myxococcales bacterium]